MAVASTAVAETTSGPRVTVVCDAEANAPPALSVKAPTASALTGPIAVGATVEELWLVHGVPPALARTGSLVATGVATRAALALQVPSCAAAGMAPASPANTAHVAPIAYFLISRSLVESG